MDSNNTTDIDKAANKDENLNDIVDDKANESAKVSKEKNSSLFKLFSKKKKSRLFDENEKIDCISKVIGNYGPWQQKFVIFYMIIYLISPFQNYGIVFYAARADFWCADLAQNLTQDELSLIKNKCIPNCKSYEHDRSLYHTTIINTFDLICDKSYLVSTAASVYQIGYAFSSILIGYLSDRYGRAPTFKGVLFLEILAGFGQAFAPSIYVFLLSRCLLGIAAYGRFLTGVLLIMETVGPKKRSVLSIMVENSWYLGHYVMIGFFYYVPNFRWVQASVTAIEILALFYFHLVPESIRWNIVKGRYDEAKQTLRTAAMMKYKNVEPEILERRIDRLINHFEEEEKKEKYAKKPNIFQMWAIPKMLGICCILYLCWFTNHLIAYSTIFNATHFGSNLYLNMTVFTTASFGANTMLYLIIERLKRRTLSRVAYIFMIICCLGLTISFYVEDQEKASLANNLNLGTGDMINEPKLELSLEEERQEAQHMRLLNDIFSKYNVDLRNVSSVAAKVAKVKKEDPIRIWLGMILKYATSTCYHTIYVLTVESFPTIIRQLSVGTCSVASRFASVVAPFTKELADYAGLPFTYGVFTTLAICSFTAIFFVPETRGLEIPDTLADCLKREGKAEKKERKKLTDDNEENTTV